jgi:hypothetical protein
VTRREFIALTAAGAAFPRLGRATTFSLIAHVGGELGTNGGTSTAINTTGADLLVVSISYYTGGTLTSLTDSTGGTWVQIVAASANIRGAVLYYLKNAGAGHTSSTHTITVAGTGIFAGTDFAAFSGSDLTAPLDQSSSANGTTTPGTPGSITPTVNNELVISSVAVGVGTPSVGSGMALLEAYADGTNVGGGMAYLIQTSAAAINPSWSYTSGDNGVTVASFKVSTGGGPTVVPRRHVTIGE